MLYLLYYVFVKKWNNVLQRKLPNERVVIQINIESNVTHTYSNIIMINMITTWDYSCYISCRQCTLSGLDQKCLKLYLKLLVMRIKRVKQQKAKTKRQIFNDSLSSRKDLLLNDFSCMMKLRGVLVNHREWDHRERYIRQAAQNVRQHILCNLSTIRVPRNLFIYKQLEFNCISRLFYSQYHNTLLLAFSMILCTYYFYPCSNE